MKYLLSIATAFLLSACVIPTLPAHNYNGETKNISIPKEGEVNTVSLGEDLLQQGQISVRDALHFETSVNITRYFTASAGDYLKIGENNKGQYFNATSTNGSSIGRGAMADNAMALMVTKENKVCVITMQMAALVCDNSLVPVIQPANVVTTSNFQQSLIYNGRVGNKINIGYRETSGNLARPAFSNNVEYDLSASNIIAYKGARLEVLNATNQSITYRVIKNFNSGAVKATNTGELHRLNPID
jgi:hypothetical protein